MDLGAFVSLEDISDALPPYREEVVSVEMDEPLRKAYEEMEQDIKKGLREHRGNQSVISVALNALLAYLDRPYGFGDLIGREFNPETQRREPFLIAATRTWMRTSPTPRSGSCLRKSNPRLSEAGRCRSMRSTRRSGT